MILCVLTPLCTVFQLFYMANFDAQAEIGMAFAFPNITHYSILCLNIQFESSNEKRCKAR